MELRHPEALFALALPLLLLSVWAVRRSAVGLTRRRLWLSLGARVLLVLALGLVLGDLRMVLPHDERAVVFALDVSESISPTSRRHMLEWTQRAWEDHQPGDQAGLVIFGADARTEVPLGLAYDPGEPSLEGLPRDGTEIHQGLRTAVGLLGSEAAERTIVLLSDGNGDAEAAVGEAMALASSGVRVSTVAVEVTPSPQEVVMGDVSAPAVVSEDEPFLLKVEITSRGGGRARVHVVRNGEYLDPIPVELAPGANVVSVPQRLNESDSYLYEVQVHAKGDGNVANNVGGAIVRVRGRQKVLLIMGPVTDDEGTVTESFREVAAPLQQVLEAAGFEVTVGGRNGLPLDQSELAAYDAFVFGGIGAERWSETQMEAVRQYVFAQGGGLIALGSDQSFGQGGYYETPIEAALPVSSDVRSKKILPSMALVFCIDRSGSMGSTAGGDTRLELAREGAARSIDLLQPFDLVGLVAFDSSPDWILDLGNVDEPNKIKAKIRQIELGGGTAIAPALEVARDSLSLADAQIKHVVLLTDGRSGESPAEVSQLLRSYARDEVTITTVGVGEEVDKELLTTLAEGTGGRFLWAPNARTVPRLLTKEAINASRALLVEGEVRPRHLGQLSELGIDWDQAPPLLGFVMTVAKPEAEVLLDTGPEETAKDGPLLVRWRYGLGKAAAFTSDGTARWTQRWLRWPGYGRLFPGLVRWVARDPEAPGVRTGIELQRGLGRVETQVSDPDGSPINGLELWANLAGPAAAGELPRLRMSQSGPGTYVAQFDSSHPGAYFVTVERVQDGQAAPLGSAGDLLAYPREYRHLTHDPGLLERLATITQGEALTLDHPPEVVFGGDRQGRASYRPLAPYLFVLAACLLLLEVALRKLVLPAGWLSGWRPRTSESSAPSGNLLERLRDRKQGEREAAAVRRQKAELEASARLARAKADAPAEPVKPKPSKPEPAPPKPVAKPKPAPPKPKPASPNPKPQPSPSPEEEPKGSMAKLLKAKRDARKRK